MCGPMPTPSFAIAMRLAAQTTFALLSLCSGCVLQESIATVRSMTMSRRVGKEAKREASESSCTRRLPDHFANTPNAKQNHTAWSWALWPYGPCNQAWRQPEESHKLTKPLANSGREPPLQLPKGLCSTLTFVACRCPFNGRAGQAKRIDILLETEFGILGCLFFASRNQLHSDFSGTRDSGPGQIPLHENPVLPAFSGGNNGFFDDVWRWTAFMSASVRTLSFRLWTELVCIRADRFPCSCFAGSGRARPMTARRTSPW